MIEENVVSAAGVDLVLIYERMNCQFSHEENQCDFEQLMLHV